MRRDNKEIWLALLAAILITPLYAFIVFWFREIPAASGFFGHLLGVLGFLLMLMTEVLYSFRKRSRKARWGSMATWLQFHIFTGLVGPYMVLLHTAWKFDGLAGAVWVLTVIIVVSGFIGRYIYTAVPRTIDGVEIQSSELESQIAAADAEMQKYLAERPELAEATRRLNSLPDVSAGGWMAVLGRTLIEWEYRTRLRAEERQMGSRARAQMKQIEQLVERLRMLRRQKNSLATARRLLSLWHMVHIPIGMALFTAAFIHIGAALYYATLLR